MEKIQHDKDIRKRKFIVFGKIAKLISDSYLGMKKITVNS